MRGALRAPPLFVPAQRPSSQTLAFQWPRDALSCDCGRLGGGVRWGQGTINLPACVCRRGWGEVVQDSSAAFLEARLGIRQRQKRGKSLSTQESFLPSLGTLSQFQGAGTQETTSDIGGSAAPRARA